MAETQTLWTSGGPLGPSLATAVLHGVFAQRFAGIPLARWTILVPTRRAARILEAELTRQSGQAALLLPRIRPIGDVDEDVLAAALPDVALPDVISPATLLFLLIDIVRHWSAANPQLTLAAEVAQSSTQAFGLAQSLQDFFEQLATEDIEPGWVPKLGKLDLAAHRNAIISLFGLVQEELPRRLQALGLVTPAQRRNTALHLEAQRMAAQHGMGPVIAAGSTGTNPAARALLKAIAAHPLGAVVLPGLDLAMDDATWEAVGDTHPQAALKTLLAALGVARPQVAELSPMGTRAQFLQAALRPAETSEEWRSDTRLQALDLAAVREGMTLVEAADRHMEARAIAVAMREVLEQPLARVALVTPDRDLAQAVRHELRRWQVELDDSGGEPLARFGRARLLMRVIAHVAEGFSPQSLAALIADPALTFGLAPDEARAAAIRFEVTALRQDLPPQSPSAITTSFALAQTRLREDRHAPRLLRKKDEAFWALPQRFAHLLAGALMPLEAPASAPLQDHLAALVTCLDTLAPPAEHPSPEDAALEALLQGLAADAQHHPVGSLNDALPVLAWALAKETLRAPLDAGTRASVFGLAEARMISADLIILGGLNEAVWPAATDSGPWFNRAMREAVGLAQPERDIGVTAHDFAQLAAGPRVMVTWSKRIGAAPAAPSRFILRLRALFSLRGIAAADQLDARLPQLAAALDAGANVRRVAMPLPRPHPELRPRTFSVTAIEKLVRDPYAIYARRILGLDPLPPLGAAPEPRLRGSLFHDALARWMEAQTAGAPATLEVLLAEGAKVFAAYMTNPEVRQFWWPRFKRMAHAFVEEDATVRADVAATLVERDGAVPFDLASQPHMLTARADRIDVTATRKVRFIDYKGSQAPSGQQIKVGLSPQMTLEAAILLQGAFAHAALPQAVDDLIYILVSGGRTPVEIKPVSRMLDNDKAKLSIDELVPRHFDGVKRLLAAYQEAGQPYVPRARMFKEDDASDYDHLSRYAEWSKGA